MSLRCVVLLLALSNLLIFPLRAAEPDPARVAQIAAWLPPQPQGAVEPVTNRAVWERLAKLPEFADAVKRAEPLLKHKLPAQPDDLYLEYSRNGNRTRFQKVAETRRTLVQTFVLAEAVENQGRFLPPLQTVITALCAERTWVLPAHDGGLKNFRGQANEIDLGVAMLAWQLAAAEATLGDRLPAAQRAMIRANLERRVFSSFRNSVRTDSGNWWLKATHNWNAVCLAGVNGAAQAVLTSPRDRAWFIAASERYVQNFLAGFTPDGYCSEGVGYWNYGFGHYTMLAETIRRATDGRLDLLADPKATRPALFGARTEILADIFPSIADCSPQSRPDPDLMEFLARRFTLPPEVVPPGRSRPGQTLYETLLFATASTNLPPLNTGGALSGLNERTWFPDGGVLICRPAADGPAFAACLKGGNNNEHHNHNDVGTFMVVSGKTMLLCDPGAEIYTARTFSAKRYDSKVLSSYGHSVPVIAGKLQRTGAAARGEVLRADFSPAQDTLRLNLRSAYDVPELQKLEREFVFRRGSGASLTVTDQFAFEKPATFEAALLTWAQWQRAGERDLIFRDGKDAVRVQVDTGGAPLDIRGETLDEDVTTPRQPVHVSLKLKAPLAKGQIKLTITPLP